MTDPGDLATVDRRPWWPLVLVIVVGLAVGGGAALVLVFLRDEAVPRAAPLATTSTTEPVDLIGALDDAGVPAALLDCVTATIEEGGAGGAAAAVEAPLAVGSESREAVEACARDHLAVTVQADADIAATDAACVADEFLGLVGLERALASIDALAVTPQVQEAARDAAERCAAAAPTG